MIAVYPRPHKQAIQLETQHLHCLILSIARYSSVGLHRHLFVSLPPFVPISRFSAYSLRAILLLTLPLHRPYFFLSPRPPFSLFPSLSHRRSPIVSTPILTRAPSKALRFRFNNQADRVAAAAPGRGAMIAKDSDIPPYVREATTSTMRGRSF